MKTIYTILIFFTAIVFTGCEDLLENELPSDQLPSDEALTSVEEMQELLNAAYDVTANAFDGKSQRFSELLADNVTIEGNTGFLVQVYNRSTDFFNSDVGDYYRQPYIAILRANVILENLDNISLTDVERDRFEGEAKFLRAINHLALVRHFAQPFGYTEDNSHPGIVVKRSGAIEPLQRSTVADAYELIEQDLLDAGTLLPGENGNYATSWSAKAYLARMYFLMNQFDDAVSYASEIISDGPFTFSDDISNRYSAQLSSESIFTIVSTDLERSKSGTFRSMYDSRSGSQVILASDEYYNLLQSSGGSRSVWASDIDGTKVFTKFNVDYMNVHLITLTEMLLLAAESYAELDQNLDVAITYVNQVKGRAGVGLLDDNASAGLIINEARKERRIEFAGEGLRLHELKRRAVLGENILIRNAPWDCNGMVLQFPASELAVKGFEMNPEGGCN